MSPVSIPSTDRGRHTAGVQAAAAATGGAEAALPRVIPPYEFFWMPLASRWGTQLDYTDLVHACLFVVVFGAGASSGGLLPASAATITRPRGIPGGLLGPTPPPGFSDPQGLTVGFIPKPPPVRRLLLLSGLPFAHAAFSTGRLNGWGHGSRLFLSHPAQYNFLVRVPGSRKT